MRVKRMLRDNGNAAIDYLIIEGGGDLKTVGITSDCICGYIVSLENDDSNYQGDEFENPIWTYFSLKDIKLIPKEILDDVKEAYNNYIDYHDSESSLF